MLKGQNAEAEKKTKSPNNREETTQDTITNMTDPDQTDQTDNSTTMSAISTTEAKLKCYKCNNADDCINNNGKEITCKFGTVCINNTSGKYRIDTKY